MKLYKTLLFILVLSSNCSNSVGQMNDAELVSKYITWTPKMADETNPYRATLLKKGVAIVPVILERYSNRDTTLTISLIWLLGEIGSPKAFDILLYNYKIDHSPRTAISLGSSLDDGNITKLVDGLKEEELKELFKNIYPQQSTDIATKSQPEIKKILLKDKESIILDCKKRSIPNAG